MKVSELALGDVVRDPCTDRTPNPDGSSCTIRVLSWCQPDQPGEVAFRYVVLGGPLDGQHDWASYAPDGELERVHDAE